MVLALGGGFQAYFKQKRDGSIYDEQMPVMAEVAKFCRARQAICHHAEAVPQVALCFRPRRTTADINGLFSRDNARLDGVLRALLGRPAVGRGAGRAPPGRPDGGVSADRGARMGVPGTAFKRRARGLRESGRQPAADRPAASRALSRRNWASLSRVSRSRAGRSTLHTTVRSRRRRGSCSRSS